MIGTTEALILGGIVLLLFGTKKLPELMKSIGQSKAAFNEGLKEGPPAVSPFHPEFKSESDAPSSEEDEDKDDAE
jgi:sec-independent protein translocase protein TatA|tara:strand:+ start:770 stop:994 length:225 start_codon:yes stop_codon:yes gene_type:complete